MGLFQWASLNLFKLNADKYHFLVITENKEFKIGIADIANSKYKRILGIQFDYKFTFENYVS